MSGERYTQIKRPVSRLTEKLLGWISWIFLLILTVITMFIALVSFSNDTSIQNLENSMNNNQLIQQILVNNSLNTTQFVIWLQNGIWAIIVYFIICLLISFLALISMNIRILSGILFLIASIITLPLVLLFITLIIPIFFFITAIMMFARIKNQNVVLVVNLQVIIMKENMIMRIIIILIKIIMSKILMMILRKINIINILNVL